MDSVVFYIHSRNICQPCTTLVKHKEALQSYFIDEGKFKPFEVFPVSKNKRGTSGFDSKSYIIRHASLDVDINQTAVMRP
jgi:hypothetical protein